MKRRTTLATAAAVALVLLAGSAAAATNLGLLDSASETGAVGRLTPQEATADTAEPDTVFVEPATQERTAAEERARVDDKSNYPNCLREQDDEGSSFDCLYDRDQDRAREHDQDREHDQNREHEREHDGREDDD